MTSQENMDHQTKQDKLPVNIQNEHINMHSIQTKNHEMITRKVACKNSKYEFFYAYSYALGINQKLNAITRKIACKNSQCAYFVHTSCILRAYFVHTSMQKINEITRNTICKNLSPIYHYHKKYKQRILPKYLE